MVRPAVARVPIMIGLMRRFLNTWVARVFFLILVVAFGVWGIGDMLRTLLHGRASNTAVATLDGQSIEGAAFQDQFQRALGRVQKALGGQEASPQIRREIASRTLDQMIAQVVLAHEVGRLGVVVPDPALRATVFAMPPFRGPNGQFDRTRFNAVLANNNLSEASFLQLMRADIAGREVQEAVRAGAVVPTTLLKQAFDVAEEKRVAAMVALPFAAAPAPPAPTEAQLRRFYALHPDRYSTPEQRRIQAVVLSTETIARGIAIPEANIRAYYDAHKADYVTPEKRSAQVIVAGDAATAQKLADQWKGGADWAAMQAAAKAAHATATELDSAAEADFPSTELGKAVFAAPAVGAISPLMKTGLGFDVVRVTAITPGSNRDFAQVKSEIHDRLAQQRAADQIYPDANKVEDALAGGDPLDKLPTGLGLAAVEGTLDAQGLTPSGQPAPIPGPPALRSKLIEAAFHTKPGEPPHLTEVPSAGGAPSSYYAVSVQHIVATAEKPFQEVAAQVRADWTEAMRSRAQNEAATTLLRAVQQGQMIAAAAAPAGGTVQVSPPIGRQANPPEGVPAELVGPLFTLKPGHATMVQTPTTFVVAQLTKIEEPDPTADPAGYAQLRQTLLGSAANDLEVSFIAGLRQRAHPRINTAQLDAAIRP